MANQIEQLEAAVEGTLARNDFYFDADESTVKVPVLFTAWSASSMLLLLGGLALWIAAAVVHFVATGPAALVCLALGAVLLAGFGWAQRRSGFEIRVAQRTVAYKRVRVPFDHVRPEELVLDRGIDMVVLRFRGHGVDVKLGEFRASEEPRAREFRDRLWELIARTDVRGAGAYGSDLTPVQWWIIGTSAVFAEVNGFPTDRLGTDAMALVAKRQRASAAELLASAWGVHDPAGLARCVDGLLDPGHREDFALSAGVAGLPPQTRDEYLWLLGHADGLVRGGATLDAPPLRDAVRRIVTLRHGAAGGRAAAAFDAQVLGDPRVPDGVAADVRSFTRQLLADRDFWREEGGRVRMLHGAHPDAVRSRYLVWDYGRAMMLYRWGHMLDWIPAEDCWRAMLPIAAEIQRHYGSWREMGAAYLDGRQLWAGGAADHHADFTTAFEAMASSPRSPWNVADWYLPLHRDWH
jgi:hypothetical protein